MDVKLLTQAKVPVRLLDDTTGAGVTGKTSVDVTVYIQPYGSSSSAKSLSVGDWVEVDAVHMPGVYDLVLSASDLSVAGNFKYSVASSGVSTYIGIIGVTAYTVADTYAQAASASSNAASAQSAATTAASNASDAKTSADAAAVVAQVAADQATLARKFVSNRLKIDVGASLLYLFDDDGVTVLYQWALKDASGLPTGTTIFERGAPQPV